jgi:hypothetical protein
MKRRTLITMMVALALLTPGALTRKADALATSASPAAVIAWNGIAQRAAIQVARQFQTQAMISIAFVQAAVYDAVVAIQGGYQPYQVKLQPQPGGAVDAAVAAAAHDVLVHYFPAQQAVLDADYLRGLAVVPDGAAKAAGVAIGQQAAAGIIALRHGDGLDADIGFTVPPPAPSVWQPPAGQTPKTSWVSTLRPFMLACSANSSW